MNDTALINIWHAYDQKLEKSLALNQYLVQQIQQQKVHSVLTSVKKVKTIMLLLGVVWSLFLLFLFVHSLSFSKIFFAVSVGCLFIFNTIAVAVYGYHIALINQINNADSVIEAQTKIGTLQASTLQAIRILFLQTPFYTTWYISFEWIKNSPTSFWFIQVPCVLLFACIGIWLFKNIHPKNKSKKWFKYLIRGKEINGPVKALAFLEEIEKFKK